MTASLISAQEKSDKSGVPSETDKLLRQLRDWEFQERTRLEQEIAKKRSQTIDQMQRHLETYTKRGDLAAANAILAEIKKLQSSEKRPPAEMTYEMPWEHEGKKGSILVTFHSDGKATWENTIVDKTFQRGFRWSIEDSGAVEFWYHSSAKGKGMQWKFAENFASAKVHDHRNGSKLSAIRIK